MANWQSIKIKYNALLVTAHYYVIIYNEKKAIIGLRKKIKKGLSQNSKQRRIIHEIHASKSVTMKAGLSLSFFAKF